MRCLILSISFIVASFIAPVAQSRTLDLNTGGMSGVTTDGLGSGLGMNSAILLRGQKVAEAIAAMARELEARADYQTILATAPTVIEMVPGNIRLRHLYALALAASGDSAAARQILEEFPEPSDGDLWGTLARAMILRSDGAMVEAQELMVRALERDPENAYAHNLAGTIAFAQEALDRAEDHFSSAIKLQPASDTYLANLGAVQRLRGNNTAAVTALQAALKINPAACGALINYAGVLQDTGDLAGAQINLETCLNSEPDNSMAIRQVVELLAARRQFDLALGIVTRQPDSFPQINSTKARLALLMGQLELAETALAEAERSSDTDLLAAFLAAGRGDLDDAAELARPLPPLMPERPDIALTSFGFLAATGAVEFAQFSFQERYPAFAPSFTYLQGLGAAVAGDEATMREKLVMDAPIPGLVLTGFPDAQIAQLVRSPAAPWLAAAFTHAIGEYHQLSYEAAVRATEADPGLALAHIMRARAAAEQRNTEDMLASLDRAIELAPTSVAANLQRGEAAMSMGDLPLAIHHFEQVLEVGDSPSAALRLGLVAERLGDDAKAEAAYERLVQITPESFIGYNQLAWFFAERERNLPRALELAEKADMLMPGNASVQDTIGWILYLQGDTASAVEYLRRSFDIAGWDIPDIGLHLAQAELSLGNPQAARDLLIVLAQRPADDPYGQKARQILEDF